MLLHYGVFLHQSRLIVDPVQLLQTPQLLVHSLNQTAHSEGGASVLWNVSGQGAHLSDFILTLDAVQLF